MTFFFFMKAITWCYRNIKLFPIPPGRTKCTKTPRPAAGQTMGLFKNPVFLRKKPACLWQALSDALLFGFLSRLLYHGNRCFLHGDPAVLVAAELYDYRIVGNINDHSVKPAGGQHGIAHLQGRDHCILLLGLLLLGTNHKEIHKCKNDYQPDNHSAICGCCICQN